MGMRFFYTILVLLLFAGPALAATPSTQRTSKYSAISRGKKPERPTSTATCKITCTVAEIAEWSDSHFPSVNLGELTQLKNVAYDSSTLLLDTNGNVKITADNSDAAQLSKDALHKLTTEYKLDYASSRINKDNGKSGGIATAWSDYSTFLRNAPQISHVSDDGALEVTLSIRASRKNIRPQDSGRYTATQTLTVCWKS